ncbi:MAG: PKD domain-containing protein [Dehalococcoidia bacterium]
MQISASPNPAQTNTTVNFSANSFGFTGSPTTYLWTFGDGTSQQTTSVPSETHSYTAANTYTATVQVLYGSSGQTGCGSTTLTVNSTGGGGVGSTVTVAPNGPYSGAINQPIQFHGLAANYNTGAAISNYAWDFGDGGTGSGQSTQHTYTAAGVFTVKLTATDANGVTGFATTAATVSGTGGGSGTGGSGTNTANGVTANTGGPYTGSSGSAISFNATGSTTNSGASIVSYVWSFGDGTSLSGQQVQHTYSSNGTFNVALTVTDSTAGGVVTATTTATIAGGSRVLPLVSGCNNVASTWADNQNPSTIASAVSPQSALLSVWKLVDPSAIKYKGFFPNASAASDLTGVNRLDAIFVCVNAPATLTEPTI